MESNIQHGYIVLADITGFTSFMEKNEIEHSVYILNDLIQVIIKQLTPVMTLAEVEGDAVFVYASEAEITRGELLLELIEATYVAFRNRQQTMQHNATCPCRACQSIPTLDLKFITHYGDYILQNVAGKTKPVGSSINSVHRLLKNTVTPTTGWKAYALFSRNSLEKMEIHPSGMQDTTETYEHLGEIYTSSINLDERYLELFKSRKQFLTPEEADVTVPYSFSASPPVVWDWLTDPHKRSLWIKGSSWEAKKNPSGRTGPSARNHCTTSQMVEEILDWHPFEYYTVRLIKGKINMIVTGELEPTENSTRIRWNMKLSSSFPRWIRRRISRHLASNKLQIKACFGLMAQMLNESQNTLNIHQQVKS